MGNVIGGGNNINFVRQANILKSAYHRGDIGNIGKKETKQKEVKDSVDMEGVKEYSRLSDGRAVFKYEDGSVQVKAPNGSIKDIDKDGNVTITLPNSLTIEDKTGEDPKVYDPSTGQYEPARKEEINNKIYYMFKDAIGNKWKADAEKLSFEVQNPSETLTQRVNTDGSMQIHTKTLSRDPDTGRFRQDKITIQITSNGDVIVKSKNLEDIAINNKQVSFTSRDDINIGIKFPYTIPGRIKGECVKPDLPPPQQEPQFPPYPPPVTPPTTPPQDGYYGIPSEGWPGYGLPAFPGLMPTGPFQQFPWPGFPMPGPMPPKPGTDVPPANTPYTPVMTPSGLMRKLEPNGSMFISLPNGIVLNQMPDGKCEAFDARYPGKVLPVSTSVVENPGFGKEIRYTFQDGAGNIVTLYSKSLDFQYASKDGNLIQNVSANGDMLILAKTHHTGPDGTPQVKRHKVLITADGRVNTFGERGVHVNNKNIVFADGNSFVNYALPYEIPLEQGLMPFIPPIGYNPPGQIPVPDPTMPCPHPSPPPSGEEPDFPPNSNVGDAGKTQGSLEGAKENQGPTQKPMKKGMWQKIKDFFKGDEVGRDSWKNRYCHGGCNRWRCGYYDPYGGMLEAMAIGSAVSLAGTVMMTTMMSWPMGMFFSPFGFWW